VLIDKETQTVVFINKETGTIVSFKLPATQVTEISEETEMNFFTTSSLLTISKALITAAVLSGAAYLVGSALYNIASAQTTWIDAVLKAQSSSMYRELGK
jgi:hypothetical protein